MVVDAYKQTFSSEKHVYNYRERLMFQDKMGVKNSYELQRFSNDMLVSNMNDNIKMVTNDKDKVIACYNDFACYKASLELYHKTLVRQRQITQNLITLINSASL